MRFKWMAVMGIVLLAGSSSAGEPPVFKTQKVILNAARTESRQKLAAVKMRKSKDPKMSAEKSKKAGEAFQEANKKREGVVVLPSGLQYEILKAGDGKIPTDNDTVDCNVRATLIDNTVFGGSPRGKPSTFQVKNTIAGLNEALKLMPVGSKWRLVIPPELAYGEKGASRRVGPNATLIYEVELLAVK